MNRLETLFFAMMVHWDQTMIVLLSGTSIFMLANHNDWGFVVGLFAQPFWFYATMKKRQWGMFALSAYYFGVYLYGIKNSFLPELW